MNFSGRRHRIVAAVVAVVSVGLLSGSAVVAESNLRVTAHGVGIGVENRQLTGESDSFPEGMQVYFWTRVEGGEAGDKIDHVWIREDGKEVSIGLSIGGPHWRTYSTKMLHPGSAGPWKVQVRDTAGNVLAESTFTCAPATEP